MSEKSSEVFREVFLSILPAEEAEAFRFWGNLLHTRFIDRSSYEVSQTSFTEVEMRGVLADLCFMTEFLRGVAREREMSELPIRDWQLAELAATLGDEVAGLSERLAARLQTYESEEP
jgi:hypothetical protein